VRTEDRNGEIFDAATFPPIGSTVRTLDPPDQNSPFRLLQNSPTQLFSLDHG